MSYILDALSKSQQERDRAQVPTLTSAIPMPESKRHVSKVWAGVSIGVLSIGVLVTAFGLTSRGPDPTVVSDGASAVAPISPGPVSIEAVTITDSGRQERIEDGNLAMAATSPILIPAKEPRRKQVSATQHKRQSSVSGISPKLEPMTIAAAPELLPTAYGDRHISPETKRLVEEMTALSEKAPRENITDDRSPAREVSRKSVPSAFTDAGNTQPSPSPERAAEKVDRQILAKISPPADPTDEVTALRDLPPETRSAIPALEVNVHTYTHREEPRRSHGADQHETLPRRRSPRGGPDNPVNHAYRRRARPRKVTIPPADSLRFAVPRTDAGGRWPAVAVPRWACDPTTSNTNKLGLGPSNGHKCVLLSMPS